MPQQVDDLAGRHLLRIEQVVDAHVDEHLFVVGFQIFVVVDAGDRLAGAELLGQHGRNDVRRLFGTHGDEEVRLAHGGLLEHRERRAVALDDDHVGHARDGLQPLGIVVHDGDVVVFAAEHLGQMAAHLPRSGDDDFHSVELSFSFLSVSSRHSGRVAGTSFSQGASGRSAGMSCIFGAGLRKFAIILSTQIEFSAQSAFFLRPTGEI